MKYLCHCHLFAFICFVFATHFTVCAQFSYFQLTSIPLGHYRCLISTPNGNVFAGSEVYRGVSLTTNNGVSWDSINQGLTNRQVMCLAAQSNDDLIAGTSEGLFRSSDRGQLWLPVASPLSFGRCYAVSIDSNVILAGKETDPPGGRILYRSTDNGSSWNVVSIPDSNVWLVTAVESNPAGNVFLSYLSSAGPAFRNYRSTDGGINWINLFPDSSVEISVTQFLFGPVPGSVFAATNQGLYHSTDAGMTWSTPNDQLQDPKYGRMYVQSIAYNSKGILFAGKTFGGIFKSTNVGEDWIQINDNILRWDEPIYSFAINPGGFLFVSSSGGIYRSNDVTTSIGQNSFSLTVPRLYQNTPNPFNPTTTIKFELPKTSYVKLSVFDILGREVSVLVNERRDAGAFEVKFDGSNLASGVYFYRLQAGDFVQSKRLLIIK